MQFAIKEIPVQSKLTSPALQEESQLSGFHKGFLFTKP